MSNFNTRRRPDAIGENVSMDAHIGASDPHNQYVLKSEIADMIAGGDITIEIPITTSFSDSATTKAAAALLTYTLKNDLDTHTGNTTIHITASERSDWNSKAPGDHTHDDRYMRIGDTGGFVTKT